MSKIPKAVSKAMDSLTARYNDDGIDRWGKPHEKIENVLPPTAWQLKVIYDFREKCKSQTKSMKKELLRKYAKRSTSVDSKTTVPKLGISMISAWVLSEFQEY